MEYVEQIAGLERRAQAINLSLHAACRAAEVNYHHITRWRSGEVNPTVRVLERDLGKLRSKLDQLERAVFEQLAPKFSEDRPAA